MKLKSPTIDTRNGVVKERIFRGNDAFPSHGLRIKFLDFHRLSMLEEYEYPPHEHRSFELILVESGPYLCLLNGMELCVPSGYSLLIQPGDQHQDHLRPGQVHYVVHFRMQTVSGEFPKERVFRRGIPAGRQVTEVSSVKEFHWLEEIAEETAGNPYAGSIQDALLEVIVWRILRRYESSSLDACFVQQTEARTFSDAIVALAAEHVRQRYSVRNLARDMGIPERTLHARCKSILGVSPAAVLRRLKLEESFWLLRDGDLSVKQVAFELGFSSAFHFSQSFKKATGSSPSDWRKHTEI